MDNQQHRREALQDALSTRILILDGAMGTMLQQRDLTAADFGGAAYEGCNENLVLTRPDVIARCPSGLFRSGGRHCRDRHLRLDAAGAGRVRA